MHQIIELYPSEGKISVVRMLTFPHVILIHWFHYSWLNLILNYMRSLDWLSLFLFLFHNHYSISNKILNGIYVLYWVHEFGGAATFSIIKSCLSYHISLKLHCICTHLACLVSFEREINTLFKNVKRYLINNAILKLG